MKIARYTNFIPQNIAPYKANNIGVYNASGKRLGGFRLQNLRQPRKGEKRYSFGALSDVHIAYDTATSDFQTALAFLNNDEDVAFTCICGDLTADGKTEEFELYKTIVDEYSADTSVYAISGNHDSHTVPMTDETISPYTGQPMYYSFEYKGDVFIMCGEWQEWNEYLFIEGKLQWLYETLEANRNKRCFVFFHVFPWGDCGNPKDLYPTNLFTGTQGTVFQSLMAHYKNVILFHGHSHFKFYLQEVDDKANYSEALGFRSIHIPSLSVPRDVVDGSLKYLYAESEGYVVDVYKNGIYLRGRDFVKEEYLPIASYWIDTTLVEVEAGTYIDNTGTITT